MSAHFDGGAEIAGRRLREVEVSYVDDPTLDMGAEDSDDCPASPPPTYYLRVREEKRSAGRAVADATSGSRSGGSSSHGRDSCDGQRDHGEEVGGQHDGQGCDTEGNNNDNNNNSSSSSKTNNKKWSWRYVNVEKKCLLVWERRGGRLLRSIPLRDVESLTVLPDQDAPASILEVYISSPAPHANDDATAAGRNSNNAGHAAGSGNGGDGVDEHEGPRGPEQDEGEGDARRQRGSNGEGARDEERAEGGLLVLQARSRRETLLWAKVLQENVELMTKRRVPLENQDEETSLSDVQQLAKLLTHQLSELKRTGDGGGDGNQQAPTQRAPSCAASAGANANAGANASARNNGTIPEGIEGGETES